MLTPIGRGNSEPASALPALERLALPVFVSLDGPLPRPLPTIPGHVVHSLDSIVRSLEGPIEAGLRRIVLYGVTATRDHAASVALSPAGPVPAALRKLRAAYPSLICTADLCVCQFLSSGACELPDDSPSALPRTLDHLAHQAVILADAGAHELMVSGVTPRAVATVRERLVTRGLTKVAILSQAAKQSSAFYSGFRAATAAPDPMVDKAATQVDIANRREALALLSESAAQGAAVQLLKPAFTTMDLLAEGAASGLQLGAFVTSGEYALLIARASLLSGREGVELLGRFHSRLFSAGAAIVVSYATRDFLCGSLYSESLD